MVDRILVVDDEGAMRRLLGAALSHSGYEIIEAVDGDDALRKARLEKPDLIISDLMMPVKDGHQLVNELRNNPGTAQVPVIMLTGVDEEHDELRAFQAGVDDYVVKPVRPAILCARVASLLNRYRAFRGELSQGIPAGAENTAASDVATSSYKQLDSVLSGGLPDGANVLVVGEIGSGKSSVCRSILAAALKKSHNGMMISLDDDPAMIRHSIDALLPGPLVGYEAENKFRLVDGYSWSKGFARSDERFAISGILELNQLAGVISDAGQELGQSLHDKAGGLRVFDSISSLFLNFELATVQRFITQLARTATSYGNVTTLFTVEAGAVSEQTLNNIKYVMDGILQTKVDSECYYVSVASMKWVKFSRDWVELSL